MQQGFPAATGSAAGTLTGRDGDDRALGRALVPAVLLLTALGLGLLVLLIRLWGPPQPGAAHPSQGAPLVGEAAATRFAYNTSPPTSGARVDRLPDRFVLPAPIGPLEQVNILAHGNVLIQYNERAPCGGAGDCVPLGERLAGVAGLYNNQPVGLNLTQGHGVVVAPNPALGPGEIVLTAWTRSQHLDQFERRAIERFIGAYLGDHDRAEK